MIKRMLIILLVCLSLCSCSSNGGNAVADNELISLTEEMKRLNTLNEKLVNENNELKRINDELTMTMEYYQLENSQEFNWLYEDQWSKITIDSYMGQFLIQDKQLLRHSPGQFIGTIRRGWEPEAMPKGIFNYTYERNDASYKIEVYGNHTFKYNNDFYYCEGDLFALHDSIVPQQYEWLKSDNPLNVIYYSQVYIKENPIFARDRIVSIAGFLNNFKFVEAPDSDLLDDKNGILKLYNHGEVLIINIYKDYVSIEYNNRVFWYIGDDRYKPEGLLSILWAG